MPIAAMPMPNSIWARPIASGAGSRSICAPAADWFHKAAVQGHVEAETNYGLTLFDQGRHAEAMPWLEKSVARGEPRAQMALGTMLYNGDGVPRDLPRAYALLVRSAASGLPRAVQVQSEMDQNIPLADRQKGLTLAKQYEADAQRPVLPADLGRTSTPAMRVTDQPPAALVATARPCRPRCGKGEDSPCRGISCPARDGGADTGIGRLARAAGCVRRRRQRRRLWSSLSGRFAGRQPAYVRAGAVTRLLVGPYASRAEAEKACAAAKPCVPIAP